MKATIN